MCKSQASSTSGPVGTINNRFKFYLLGSIYFVLGPLSIRAAPVQVELCELVGVAAVWTSSDGHASGIVWRKYDWKKATIKASRKRNFILVLLNIVNWILQLGVIVPRHGRSLEGYIRRANREKRQSFLSCASGKTSPFFLSLRLQTYTLFGANNLFDANCSLLEPNLVFWTCETPIKM